MIRVLLGIVRRWLIMFAIPWLPVEEQARIFVSEIKDKKHAFDFVSKGIDDVADKYLRLSDHRISEVWTCTAIILTRPDLAATSEPLRRDTARLRLLLDKRTKLYRMQQAVLFFVALFLLVTFVWQAIAVAVGGGARIDHRFAELPRVDFRRKTHQN